MFSLLVYLTLAACVVAPLYAFAKYRDIFHPLILVAPMCAFIYVYMPLKFIRNGELSAYLTDEQCIFVQLVVLLALIAWFGGCLMGSGQFAQAPRRAGAPVDANVLLRGAYTLGVVGFLCWYWTIRAAGGISGAFGVSYGAAWSEYGYLREAVYLLLVAVLLLLTPEAFSFPQRKWTAAIVVFSTPWLLQALLGARRGPTFIITVAIGMSWFIARGKRPSPFIMISSGCFLGLFMLFLVANRGSIYLGSDFENLTLDVTEKATEVSEANEYIFGAGTMIGARATGKYYWGWRYLAQILVRPIPRQIWPNKYADVGLADLEQNAGVAVEGMSSETGLKAVPGAAAAMVADFWVEFSWLCIPFCAIIGWVYGRVWRRAVVDGRFWNTQYVILCMLSIFMVTQSGEAVIFRLVLLSVPSALIWRRAIKKGQDLSQTGDTAKWTPVLQHG